MPQPQRPWTDFMYAEGTAFDVDGPALYNGTGHVLANGLDELEFELHMPEWKILIFTVAPEFHVRVKCKYNREGAGNEVTVTDLLANPPTESVDANAVIITYAGAYRRRIDTVVQFDPANPVPLEFDLNWVYNHKIETDITFDSKTHRFDLLG